MMIVRLSGHPLVQDSLISAIAKSYNRRHEKLQPKSQKASTMMTENYGDDGEAAAGR